MAELQSILDTRLPGQTVDGSRVPRRSQAVVHGDPRKPAGTAASVGGGARPGPPTMWVMEVWAPKIKFCGITSMQDAERAAAAGAWALGLNFWPDSPRRCDPAVAAEIATALKRRLQIAGVFVNAELDELARIADSIGLTMIQLHGDEGPAFCAEVARRTGCKVIKAARVRSRRRHPGAVVVPHRLSPARQLRARMARGDRRDVRVGARSGPPRARAGDPVRRLERRQRGRGDRHRTPIRRRRRQRRRERSRAQGSGRCSWRSPRRSAPRSRCRAYERGRAPLRPLRRAVRARDADAGAGRARGGVDRGSRRSRLPRRARGAAARLRRPPDAALPRGRASATPPATRSTSSARTSTTPARTRSTTRSARRCWPGGWASRGSSPRPAPASTGWRPPPRARCSTSSASSTWGPRTCAARRRTSSGWGCSARRVEPVEAGARTLKEAVSAAIRDWVTNVETTHYIIGSCVGPAPYPALVRDLQRVIGDEARAQVLEQAGRLPQRVIACVGGGSNSIGIFTPFVDDAEVELIGSRPPARGSRPAATARR